MKSNNFNHFADILTTNLNNCANSSKDKSKLKNVLEGKEEAEIQQNSEIQQDSEIKHKPKEERKKEKSPNNADDQNIINQMTSEVTNDMIHMFDPNNSNNNPNNNPNNIIKNMSDTVMSFTSKCFEIQKEKNMDSREQSQFILDTMCGMMKNLGSFNQPENSENIQKDYIGNSFGDMFKFAQNLSINRNENVSENNFDQNIINKYEHNVKDALNAMLNGYNTQRLENPNTVQKILLDPENIIINPTICNDDEYIDEMLSKVEDEDIDEMLSKVEDELD